MRITYVTCPNCEASITYDKDKPQADGSYVITCTNCGTVFAIRPGAPAIPTRSSLHLLMNRAYTDDVDAPSFVDEFVREHSDDVTADEENLASEET